MEGLDPWLAAKRSSHPQDRHGHKTKDVGEDELLVDGQVEPGVVGQEGGVLALSGEEEGKDAHNRCHASNIVWRLSFCNGRVLLESIIGDP